MLNEWSALTGMEEGMRRTLVALASSVLMTTAFTTPAVAVPTGGGVRAKHAPRIAGADSLDL